MLASRRDVRLLGSDDRDAFLALVGRDPVVNVFAEHRARTTNLEPRWLGGEVWGRFGDGELVSACHLGANLVPVGWQADDVAAYLPRVMARNRSTATIVGPHDSVAALWDEIADRWPSPRELRWHQPHLELSGAPAVEPDPGVRLSRPEDVPHLYPACVAMYTEEVGVSPEGGGGREQYLARVRQLVAKGWSFARYDDSGEVIFKAEVACATPHAAQVQGVWVRPEHRGRGVAVRGMAAVVELVRRDVAPVVSLYVNEWNDAARAAYARTGFVETARFATLMF